MNDNQLNIKNKKIYDNIFALAKKMGGDDDLLVINYMTDTDSDLIEVLEGVIQEKENLTQTILGQDNYKREKL